MVSTPCRFILSKHSTTASELEQQRVEAEAARAQAAAEAEAARAAEAEAKDAREKVEILCEEAEASRAALVNAKDAAIATAKEEVDQARAAASEAGMQMAEFEESLRRELDAVHEQLEASSRQVCP